MRSAQDGNPSVRAFLSAIRRQPGFWLKVASTSAFASSLAITRGLASAMAAIALGLALIAVLGLPLYRRRGHL